MIRLKGSIDNSFSGMSVIGKQKLIVQGGIDRNEKNSNKVFILDLGNQRYQKCRDMTVSDRFKHNMLIVRDDIIIVIGLDIQVYDVKKDIWS